MVAIALSTTAAAAAVLANASLVAASQSPASAVFTCGSFSLVVNEAAEKQGLLQSCCEAVGQLPVIYAGLVLAAYVAESPDSRVLLLLFTRCRFLQWWRFFSGFKSTICNG